MGLGVGPRAAVCLVGAFWPSCSGWLQEKVPCSHEQQAWHDGQGAAGTAPRSDSMQLVSSGAFCCSFSLPSLKKKKPTKKNPPNPQCCSVSLIHPFPDGRSETRCLQTACPKELMTAYSSSMCSRQLPALQPPCAQMWPEAAALGTRHSSGLWR